MLRSLSGWLCQPGDLNKDFTQWIDGARFYPQSTSLNHSVNLKIRPTQELQCQLCDYITCQKFPPIKKNFPCQYYKAFMVVIKVQDASWLVTLRHFYPSLIFLRKGRTSQSVPAYGDNEALSFTRWQYQSQV